MAAARLAILFTCSLLPFLIYISSTPIFDFRFSMMSTNITSLIATDVVAGDKQQCQHGKNELQIIGYAFETGAPINRTTGCVCDEGWKIAGLTDTINNLMGICTQYECTTDERCVAATGVAKASCPIVGWNCECPLSYALKSWMMGYETYSDGNSGVGTGGRCMGILYYLSVHGSELCNCAFKNGWNAFLILALCLAPFGQRRRYCTHRQHSLLNAFLSLVDYRCDGNCTNDNNFMDDFAWSLYALQWMVWYHLAVVVVWVTCLWIWCMAVWLMVMVIISLVVIVVVVNALGGHQGGGHNACGECTKCDNCSLPECSGDCFYCSPVADPRPVDVWIFYTPTAYSNSSNSRDCGTFPSCSKICHPLMYLITLLPSLPQNLWGGLLGYYLGTHAACEQRHAYQGGSSFIDLLGFQRWRQDDYTNQVWRERLLAFLSISDTHGGAPQQATMIRASATRRRSTRLLRENDVGKVEVIRKTEAFDVTRDSCTGNTFEDYTAKTCWICREDEITSFDRYACGHIFCTTCSQCMMGRNMPCPLCRVYTPYILRTAH